MARLPRIHLEGAVYFVTSRGDSPEPIFKDRQDYEAYLGLVTTYKRRYGFKLYAYCLLPDHVHLYLEPAPGATLSAIMHDLTAGYTRHFNKRYGRTGHLFQERFKAVVVEKRPFLLPVTAYLHRHPVHSGLAEEFRDYPLSSYHHYCASRSAATPPDMTREIQEVFALLPGERTACTYERYINEMPNSELGMVRDGLQKPILGSDAFVDSVRARLKHTAASHRGQKSREDVTPRPRTRQVVGQGVLALLVGGLVVGSWLALFSAEQEVDRLMQTLASFTQQDKTTARAQGIRVTSVAQDALADSLGSLEESEWQIRLIPMHGVGPTSLQQDRLQFARGRVSSEALGGQGFEATNYTLTLQRNGTLVWETMQTGPSGEVVCWRGEWDGRVMRGILTRQPVGRDAENFTFMGSPAQPVLTTRSEI